MSDLTGEFLAAVVGARRRPSLRAELWRGDPPTADRR
jgi:hypothetical protein